MIMMSYSWRWSSLQLTGQADFCHPTRVRAVPSTCDSARYPRSGHLWGSITASGLDGLPVGIIAE